jgi:hypothetical protein
MKTKYENLLSIVKEMYLTGRWTCDAISEAKERQLWARLRDAAGIPRGTATAAGIMSEPRPVRDKMEERAYLISYTCGFGKITQLRGQRLVYAPDFERACRKIQHLIGILETRNWYFVNLTIE